MKNKTLLCIAAAIGAIIVFQVTYTFKVLDPTNVNWLMTVRDDWGTHYLGWFFYRNEPWTFPLGNVSGYYHSIGTNVGFTDSIPLMAIFFKIFSPILPANFQYFGLWFLLCDLLIALYTVKLLQLFRIHPVYIILSVLFVVANPMLVYRGQHPALCAHWLLIGSLYLYFLDPRQVQPRKILTHQAVLLLLAAAINPYLCMMVTGMSIALGIKLWRYDKANTKKDFFRYLAFSMGGMLLVWFLIGLINFSKKDELGVGGAYGLYSLNLNSLYNSGGFSTYLPAQKQVSWQQFESYMYLGMGIFLLLAVLLIVWLYGRMKKKAPGAQRSFLPDNVHPIPLLIVLLVYTLFAITQNVSIGDHVLLRIPLPRFVTNLGDVFRASARFFWLPYYVILFSVLVAVARLKAGWPVVLSLFVIALTLQSYDIKLLLTFRRYKAGAYNPPLDKRWATLIGQFDHVVFYPPFEAQQLVRMDYQDFGYVAASLRKTINIGYVARGDGSARKKYADSLRKDLENGQISYRALYITTPAYLSHFAQLLQLDSADLHFLDGYYFLYARGIKNQLLDTLTTRLDAANKKQLDSVLLAIRQKNEFAPTAAISHSDGKPIRYFISSINKGRTYISLDGWGFIDSTQNNKGDSTFITLTSPQGSYIASTHIFLRPDLTDYYKRPYLTDGGFNTVAFFDSLPAGQYQLGIAIKDQQGRYICQEDSNHVEVR